MAEQSGKSNPFMTMFVPGLILGLVVGGLAGAFLPPIISGMNGPASSGPVQGAKPTPPAERDARPAPTPGPPAATPKPADSTPPADTKPTEPKPADAPAPVTPPAAAPK